MYHKVWRRSCCATSGGRSDQSSSLIRSRGTRRSGALARYARSATGLPGPKSVCSPAPVFPLPRPRAASEAPPRVVRISPGASFPSVAERPGCEAVVSPPPQTGGEPTGGVSFGNATQQFHHGTNRRCQSDEGLTPRGSHEVSVAPHLRRRPRTVRGRLRSQQRGCRSIPSLRESRRRRASVVVRHSFCQTLGSSLAISLGGDVDARVQNNALNAAAAGVRPRQPALSEDGETLIFTSNRPGESANNDLWMSTRRPGGPYAQ